MGTWEICLLAVGVAMDAFAVSVCKGLSMQKAGLREGAICGLWFGGFQAIMPLLGYLLGEMFSRQISNFDHWVAFGLLALIGINMLKEAFEYECGGQTDGDLSVKTMFLMAIATSIDALAVGISLAMAGDVNITLAVVLIGTVTFLLCMAGVKVGSVFGCRYKKKAEIAGGLILILLGIKILLEHIGIL